MVRSLLFCFSALILIFSSCEEKPEKIKIDPAFGEYIQGYTSGVISVDEPIVIELAKAYEKGNTLPDRVLEFEPQISGNIVFIDNQRLVFKPAQKLKGGTVYTARLDLPELFTDARDLGVFSFQIQTIDQNLSIYFDGYELESPTDISQVVVSGTVRTADNCTIKELQESLRALQGDTEKQMELSQVDLRRFKFSITGVQRLEESSNLTISVSGNTFEQKHKNDAELIIPSINDFSVMSAEYLKGVEEIINIYFSDPLESQELVGSITLEDVDDSDLSFKQNGNKISVSLKKGLQGEKLLTVMCRIKNTAGREMGKNFTKTMVFDPENPAVRMVGNKFIVPTQSEGLIFPFEAVSLNAVDIYITKVFSNNVLQYLQTNDQGGNRSLYSVGRKVYKKHLDLRKVGADRIYEWNRYHVDLSQIINKDKSALYEVEVRFKKNYAALDCIEPDAGPIVFQDGWLEDSDYLEEEYWQYYRYDWDQRDNPCNQAYYNRYRTKSGRVVMATNLGVIAKKGGDGLLHLVVTDIKSAKAVSGATVEVFDFQQQLVGNGKTDSEGFATVECSRSPLAVLVKTADDQTIMKVNDGSSLSLSKFDVQGKTIKDGLKGFIYGERGVWRPGDSLHINFILSDESGKLPDNHPVKMQLYNSRGQLADMQVKSTNLNGFYDFSTVTAADDPTGDYRLKVSVGNQDFEKRIPIETIKPNRLKIDLEIDQSNSTSESIKASLSAAWLHGVIATGLKADVSMRLSSTKTSFDRFRGFHFDNLLESNVSRNSEKVFEGTLDNDGKKSINISMSDRGNKASGKLKAYFETKVYEPGGGFSVDYYNAIISPYSSYVGLKVPEGELWGGALETEKDHLIELAAVLESGQVPENKDVQVTIYRVDRRWWFDRYSGNQYNYLNTASFRKHQEETVALVNGRGSINVNMDKENWGRYLIRVEDKVSGHSAAQFVFFDWPYWMRTNRTEGEAASILGFSSDRETYNPGDVIKISFPSPKEGRALVTIENGTSVLVKRWVETTEGETKVEIPVTGDMAPNAYIHISLVQPHDQTVNDRPIRMFGVIPITVEDQATILSPELRLPKVIRPEQSFEVEVSEKNGSAMTYTLAIVDEGLLDLTNFKTPDPHGYFYAHEALGVRTWDYYDHVVGAIGTVNSGILSIGGDDEAADPSKQKARRFKPVVHHLGPFELKEGKSQEHVIDMPNYVGSVRVMVVAGNEDAFGKTEKTVPVKSELMVLGTLPRVLGPGETVSVPVNVFAMEDGVKDVTVTLKSNEFLLAQGEVKKTIRFDKPGEQMVYFEMKTIEAEGVAEISILATARNKKASYEAEVQLRSPNPIYSTLKDTAIAPNGKWSQKITYFGLEGTNKAGVEVSKLPSIKLEKRLGYLMGYPHGCVEQLTSKAFPQLYLGKFVSLTSNQQAEITENVDYVLRQLRSFQISGGGFSYWPGLSYGSDWGTTYAGHFMLAAEEAGYALPAGMKRDWINYQKRQAGAWVSSSYTSRSYSQRSQAYRLLTLAIANQPDFGAMNTLRERSNLDNSSKWILSLAYATAGRSKEALALVQFLPKNIDDYTELGYSYGSSTRDEAFVLMALHKLDQSTDAAMVARRLAKKLGSESFYSTQTTAMTLLALAGYLGEYNDDGLKFDLSIDGKSEAIQTGKPVHSAHFGENEKNKQVTIQNESEQTLYATLITSGRPAEGREKKQNSNLLMEVNYLDSNFEPIDESSLKKGTDIIVEIVITNPKNRQLSEMALIHGIPSGWEILNSRMSGMTDASSIEPEYQDIRDDKVMTYFDLKSNQKIRLYARINASYSGRFYLPAIVCNAMYDETIISVEPGKWIEVK
jgi:uncharacterized protein YfaS (alpha-2-macroglobulin family)